MIPCPLSLSVFITLYLSPSLNYLNVLGALAKGDECLASAPEDGLLGPKDLTGLDAAPLPTILDLLDTTTRMEIIVKKRVSNEKRGRGSDCVKDRLNILEREIREGRREERMKG